MRIRHSYIPSGNELPRNVKLFCPASSSPEDIRATCSPSKFTTDISAYPADSDVKEIWVDWEKGLGNAIIEMGCDCSSTPDSSFVAPMKVRFILFASDVIERLAENTPAFVG